MTSAHFPQVRLRSLDAFRGLAIAGMILVNNPGSWAHVYPPLRHAEWHGWTPTDLIFPFFLFIVGVAIPFSFGKRLRSGSSKAGLFLHVVRRSAILFALGLLMAAFPSFDFADLRIMGVLQRIGLVYLVAAPLFMFFGPRVRGGITVVLLMGYWALLALVPVPGFGAGDLSPEGNLGAFLDRMILGDRLWAGTWDPEGLLSTLPAVATALLGVFAGEWILSSRPILRKASGMLGAGIIGMGVGSLWDLAFPINKGLWTSSYVLFTAGVALVLLSLMFWAMEIRLWRGWAKPLVVYGMNAISVFVASGLLARILGLVRIGEESVSLKAWLYEGLFTPWAGPVNGSLAFAVSYVLLWLIVAWAMFAKRVFLKI
ncbi:acyltransferase family protein [Gemmatimonadota bacterium]